MADAQPEMLAVVLDDIVGPPLPPLAARAWDVFRALSDTRMVGMGGVGPITYTEMAAFEQLTDTPLTPLDVALVREADAVFLTYAMSKLRAARDEPVHDSPTPPED